MDTLPVSKLVKKQVITKTVEGLRIDGGHGKLKVNIRYDDQCGNGHNSFSITADLYRDGQHWPGGCLHDDILEFAPEFAHLIKWHLAGSNGPIHYIENTTYHAKEVKKLQHFVYLDKTEVTGKNLLGLYSDDELQAVKDKFKGFSLTINTEATSDSKDSDIDAARECAIWPEATLEQLQDKEQLQARLLELMREFKGVIESLGMEY